MVVCEASCGGRCIEVVIGTANQRLEPPVSRVSGTKSPYSRFSPHDCRYPSGGLQPTKPDHFKIRRVRRGAGFAYLKANGRPIRQRKTIRRLERLAVPPAYRDTRFAINPRAHIQAVGRDTAGRLQYRYHPEWEQIRELRKARRLAKLIDLMPGIRRSITKLLKQTEIDRDFAAAALVDLIACTAIRPGSETYVRERGTRGAATLLKKHIQITGDEIALRFPGKGGKEVEKVCSSNRLVKTIRRLQKLPGNRLFQYISDDGVVRRLRRRDANAFLCEITNNQISLKDFRTLSACSQALAHLSRLDPKPSQRGKRAQIKSALETWPTSSRIRLQCANAATSMRSLFTPSRRVD